MPKFDLTVHAYILMIIIFANNIFAMENSDRRRRSQNIENLISQNETKVKTLKGQRSRSTRWEKPAEKKQNPKEKEERISGKNKRSNTNQELVPKILPNINLNQSERMVEEESEELREIPLENEQDEPIELEQLPGQPNDEDLNEIALQDAEEVMCESLPIPQSIRNMSWQAKQTIAGCFGPIGAYLCFCWPKR